VVADLLFVAGAVAVTYGAHLVAPWFAWMVGGAQLMLAGIVWHAAKVERH